MESKLMTVAEVSELIGVSIRTVWRMAMRGDLPAPIRFGARTLRWDSDQLNVRLKPSQNVTRAS